MNVRLRNVDDVALLLKRLRKEAGVTLRHVEEVTGVPVATQSQWETGRRAPRLSDVLIKLLRFYEVSITFGWEGPADERRD